MEIVFEKSYLSELYYDGKCEEKKYRFQPQVVRKYVKTVNMLEAATVIEDLFVYKSLHFETLVGDKQGLSSVRVNDQYRIEFKISKTLSETAVTICSIIELSNHYK